MDYFYFINLDERGSFRADVRDHHDKTVLEILGGNELGEGETSLVDDGFMKHFSDLNGLAKYMRMLGFSVSSLTMGN